MLKTVENQIYVRYWNDQFDGENRRIGTGSLHFMVPLNVDNYYRMSEIDKMHTAGPYVDFSRPFENWQSDNGEKFP